MTFISAQATNELENKQQKVMYKVREENKEVLIEIRKIRQAIIENLEIGGFNPIDKDLDKRLNDRLEELKKIFK